MKWRYILKSILGTLGGRKNQDGVDLDVIETMAGDVVGEPG